MEVRINEVKISCKAVQGTWILLRISGDLELSEFELQGSDCSIMFQKYRDSVHEEKERGCTQYLKWLSLCFARCLSANLEKYLGKPTNSGLALCLVLKSLKPNTI